MTHIAGSSRVTEAAIVR